MSNSIPLKVIDHQSHEHQGWGAGTGATINITYECPCGKGKVFYEKEDTPGFRESSIDTNCDECREKYEFHRGEAINKQYLR